jgi:hypothetical protein
MICRFLSKQSDSKDHPEKRKLMSESLDGIMIAKNKKTHEENQQ